ncbi:MAG: methylmalonyl-CoA epimerase, partial [Bdellovibrionales bacterium]|nr:methylmalonyl-CoA epimerase [Bdellovibrionales bacterium]
LAQNFESRREGMKRAHYAVDHIGVAVLDLDQSIAHYKELFGFELYNREKLVSAGVEVAFLDTGNTFLELLVPLSSDSTLGKYMQQRGESLHHVCYEVNDIERELERFRGLGVRLLDEIPRPGAHHSRIAFLHPKDTGGVLTELCEYP